MIGRAWRVVRGWRGLVALVLLGSGLIRAQDLQLRYGPPGLTVFRPQYGAGTYPFGRTAVPDALEEDALLGPGIRRNGAGEVDPAGEDDLIELTVWRAFVAQPLVLRRGASALSLWTTATKSAGTEIAFTGDFSAPLVFGASNEQTVWVEWDGAVGVTVDLELQALGTGRVFDRVQFHVFEGLVVALGGEDQVPQLPLDPNHGSYIVATELYRRGWDVLMRDEDEVSPVGTGPVHDEVVNAIQQRSVGRLSIFGYSHGGGSTYDLCDLLLGTPGSFTVDYTSYVDGVENGSDTDLAQELRRPMGTAHHVNHYQHGSLFVDLGLDGGPVPSSFPAPTGLDVETVFWGASATHFTVDDYFQVTDYIRINLESHTDLARVFRTPHTARIARGCPTCREGKDGASRSNRRPMLCAW